MAGDCFCIFSLNFVRYRKERDAKKAVELWGQSLGLRRADEKVVKFRNKENDQSKRGQHERRQRPEKTRASGSGSISNSYSNSERQGRMPESKPQMNGVASMSSRVSDSDEEWELENDTDIRDVALKSGMPQQVPSGTQVSVSMNSERQENKNKRAKNNVQDSNASIKSERGCRKTGQNEERKAAWKQESGTAESGEYFDVSSNQMKEQSVKSARKDKKNADRSVKKGECLTKSRNPDHKGDHSGKCKD